MYKFISFFILFGLLSFTKILIANENDSKSYFGVDGGYAFVDLKAEETAQTLANLSGSTVTYQEDQAAGYLRFYYGFAVSENLDLQAGYFNTSKYLYALALIQLQRVMKLVDLTLLNFVQMSRADFIQN